MNDSNQGIFSCPKERKWIAIAQAQVPGPSKQPRIFQCKECSYQCGYEFNLKKHVTQNHLNNIRTEVPSQVRNPEVKEILPADYLETR